MIDGKTARSNLDVGSLPRLGRGKIQGAIKQFMDIMVEGLSPPARMRGKLYDLVVVGGGYVGLTAAMEAAWSGLDTLLMERADSEKAKGAVQCVRCCPGAVAWLDGGGLVDPNGTEAECFNLDILPGTEVTSVCDEGDFKVVGTGGEQEYRAKAVLLSPGSRYRRLNVPGEEELIGVDVHSCAACEGTAYRGQEVVVLGSSDSAFEQALDLATYASRVTVLELRDRLMCSQRIADKAGNHVNLEVRLNTKVVGLKGESRLHSVVLKDLHTGNAEEVTAAAVFVLMGLEPNTEFLRGVVELDSRGYIITDGGLKTNLAGVYAAGDARSGRDIDPREAADEGFAAVFAIRRFLEGAEINRG